MKDAWGYDWKQDLGRYLTKLQFGNPVRINHHDHTGRF